MFDKLLGMFERVVVALEKIAESFPTKEAKKTKDKAEPAKTEPAKTEPAKTEPAKTEPAKTEPAKTEPAKTEPAKTEPAKTEPAKTEQTSDDDMFGNEPVAPTYTMEQVKSAFAPLIAKSKDLAKKVIVEVGNAPSISTIKPEKFAAVMEAIKANLA